MSYMQVIIRIMLCSYLGVYSSIVQVLRNELHASYNSHNAIFIRQCL
jgi:hypothetical protein